MGPPQPAKEHPTTRAGTPTLAQLVDGALDGDATSWETLVDRLAGVVWKTISGFRLNHNDREDAFASTFYRLYDKLATVRQPEALPGWVATTARNEVHTILRTQGRSLPMETLPLREIGGSDIDEKLLDDELLEAVAQAFATLPDKAQALLRALTTVPPLSYQEIGRLLDMPVGSIGPMRGQYLRRLRLALHGYLEGESA